MCFPPCFCPLARLLHPHDHHPFDLLMPRSSSFLEVHLFGTRPCDIDFAAFFLRGYGCVFCLLDACLDRSTWCLRPSSSYGTWGSKSFLSFCWDSKARESGMELQVDAQVFWSHCSLHMFKDASISLDPLSTEIKKFLPRNFCCRRACEMVVFPHGIHAPTLYQQCFLHHISVHADSPTATSNKG